MACDGDIDDKEVQLVKDYVKNSSLFDNLEVEKLMNEYIASINSIGVTFLKSYLKELREEEMTTEQEIQIMKIAIEMIEIDEEVRYSEVKFFKQIYACLNVADEVIEKEFPDKEDYFLPDIVQQEYEFIMDSEFSAISFDFPNANCDLQIEK